MLAGEGECIEAINLRIKDDTMVPVPVPTEEALLKVNYSRIFWHELASCFLCVTDDEAAVLHAYDSKWQRMTGEGGEPLEFSGVGAVTNVEFVGYVACCICSAGIVYMLYSDGRYIMLGERPPMPQLEITVSSKLSRLTTEVEFHNSTSDNIESSWQYNSKGYFDEAISALNNTGHYIDRALFKYALRTFDGSYISISPAMYVSDEGCINWVGRDGFNLYSEAVSSSSSSKYDVAVIGFKTQFTFLGLELADWKNIVVGIDVFTTGSIMGSKAEKVRWRRRSSGSVGEFVEYECYTVKEFDELCNEIADARHYYRIAEYDIDGNLIEALEDVSSTSLALQQTLENDDCYYSSMAPGCSYMFNNRLHIGALKEYFFKGYDPVFLKGPYGDRRVVRSVVASTRINTSRGTSVVVREYGNMELMYVDGCYELPPLLSYPDMRACEMTLYVNTGEECYCRTFELTPHRYLNTAQYLNRWSLGFSVSCRANISGGAKPAPLRDKDVVAMFNNQEGQHKIVYSKSRASWMYNDVPFPTDEKYAGMELVLNSKELADGDSLTFTIRATDSELCFRDVSNIVVDASWTRLETMTMPVEEEPYEVRRNVLKVSSVENPFSFPLHCTYTPSQAEIVAIASNTVALSQGQFGQHPLYVFCNDGIWSMSVDSSGATAYLASYPLSREVCVNPQTVCGIDGGVVFAARQGVMLLSGGKMKCISASMNGNPGVFRRITADGVIKKIHTMMQLPDVVGEDDFSVFMREAKVSYLPACDEIMFASAVHGFCYLYSLRSAVWTQVALEVKGFVRGYSFFRVFAPKDNGTLVMQFGDAYSGDNRVLVVTRPQLWGTKLPKRIIQLMLHASAKPVPARNSQLPVLACYMLGSNDGVNFKLIAGRETVKELCDLKFPYFPTQAYRYYLFVVCGELAASSFVTGIDIDVKPAWNSRN